MYYTRSPTNHFNLVVAYKYAPDFQFFHLLLSSFDYHYPHNSMRLATFERSKRHQTPPVSPENSHPDNDIREL
ncbi:hypothetical protein N7486_002734 [Penicillium sp. IBT 16267x]|nr:hypothetical protein N7486_002734 [Penicillium sp. IBT 16267x]